MLFSSNIKYVIHDLKSHLLAQLDMKELGATKYTLGMENRRDRPNKKDLAELE